MGMLEHPLLPRPPMPEGAWEVSHQQSEVDAAAGEAVPALQSQQQGLD